MYLQAMNIQQAASLTIVIAGAILLLILGKYILIPLIFALLIWLLVRRIKLRLMQIPVIRKWFPGWLTNLIMSALIFTAFTMIGRLLSDNIESLARSYETYGNNIQHVAREINAMFHIEIEHFLNQYAGSMNFGKAFASLFASLSGLIENTIVILLYVAFIFLEESNFTRKLTGIFPNPRQYKTVLVILDKIETSVANYIGLKTLVNLVSSTVSFFLLWGLGIESPLFWAFLIFLLNFIPVIGLFAGVLLPTAFALIQFGSYSTPLIILGVLGGVQFISGNILEPRVMGNSLNISPLVALVALAFWGTLWGITGMFLSVPITVIMIIVFSQFKRTRPIAILLSEKGELS